jgi:hypothetical protein
VNDLINNSPTAARIIKRLQEDCGKPFTIKYGPENTYIRKDRTIEFDRDFQSDRADMKTPPEIPLAHELIHALHDLDGNFMDWFTPFTEERQTVGIWPFDESGNTENQIRSDYRNNGIDVPRRDSY